jgi:hypothetical protein
MAALPETAPIRDSRSRRLKPASSLGILLVVQSFSPPLKGNRNFKPFDHIEADPVNL